MNAGYKGKVNVEYGTISAPYNPFMRTSYQDYLHSLDLKFTSSLEEALEMMQERYPGNYILIEKYNHIRGTFELAVKFNNPKEEMLWKMKWA